MIVAAILAAGASTRLAPRRKQLVLLDGEPLVRRAARLVRAAAKVDRVAVVLGAFADEIAPALAGLDVELVDNAAWSEGMAASVRAAATWAADLAADALVLATCDQPALSTAHVEQLLADPTRTTGSAYGGAIGVPAVFPAARFPDLLALHGDRGARALLVGAASIALPGGERDVDTPADL